MDPFVGERVRRVVGIDENQLILNMLFCKTGKNRLQLTPVIEVRLQSSRNFLERNVVVPI